MIVNLGAVDILLGHKIEDIMTHYARLIRAIVTFGWQPIITTLPKVGINKNKKDYKCTYQTLLLFNHFLICSYSANHLFIDLFAHMFDHNEERMRRYFNR